MNSDEEEEITTRQEITFDYPPLINLNSATTIMPDEVLDQNTIIMQALAKLLNQESGSSFCPRICEPDTYHGSRNLDAAIGWVRSVERYLEMANLEKHRWVDYAATLFRDEADTWWRQQELLHDNDDWLDFKKRFLANFSPPNHRQLARDRLAALIQTGTVADYVTQFQAAWSSVPTMGEEEALDRFQRGLNPQIRLQVMTRFPDTPDVAMNLALAVEAAQQRSQTILGDGSRFHQQSQHPQHVHSQLAPEYLRTSGVAPMDLDAIQSRGPGQWRSSGHGGSNWRSQGNRRNSNDHEKQCYNCSGFGHLARFCSSPRRQQSQGRQGNQSRWNQGKGQARRN